VQHRWNLCLKNRNLAQKYNRFKNAVETSTRLEPLALKGYTAAH
jgi:zona occludens toxin (predicted ATPase)